MPTFQAAKISVLAACLTALVIGAPASSVAQAGVASDSAPPSEWTSSADSVGSYDEPMSVWNAHRVVRVLGDGSHGVLGDGTIWEIYLPDRASVNTWRRGDMLLVRESSVSHGEFDYSLTDGRTRGAVAARLVGAATRRS